MRREKQVNRSGVEFVAVIIFTFSHLYSLSERFAIIKCLNGGKISAAVASPSSFQAVQHTLGDSRLT
jgi:hypothetical protein